MPESNSKRRSPGSGILREEPMRLGPSCLAMTMLGLLGCASGSTDVGGTDAASIRNAPAGVATLQFMDLEAIRPDMLASASSLPAGVTSASLGGGVTRYSCDSTVVKAANAGSLGGYVDITAAPVTGGTAYTEDFHLSVVSSDAPAQTWSYTGQQLVTVTGALAGFALATTGQPLTLTLVDTAVPANNKTYTFTPSLTESWVGANPPTSVTLNGTYLFAQTLPVADAKLISCDLTQQPLVWTPAECPSYPNAGTLVLSLNTTPVVTATVKFGPTCGQATLNGARLGLGGN